MATKEKAKKKKIARDMLERYTGHDIKDFQKQIIITNFHYYIERFNALLPDNHYTQGSAFKASSSKKAKVTIIEFGIGSAMAALIGALSGLLIGHEIKDGLAAYRVTGRLLIVGDAFLAQRYKLALAEFGINAELGSPLASVDGFSRLSALDH